jgi:serine/threonine-protein phosphatase 2A regulatory subunit A
MAASGDKADDSLYPIAVLIDELKNEDIQVGIRAPFHMKMLEMGLFWTPSAFLDIILFLDAK